jgi:predicted enzyme related to lactoylglutathione lyase
MPSAKTTQNPATTSKPTAQALRPGFISHTELASDDPAATKAWCQKVLGWKFAAPVQIPNGEYHTWSFQEGTGGGIRQTNPGEPGGSIPYAEVPDIKAAEAASRKAGAKTMMEPTQVPGSGGLICVVQAPGGVPIGFWAPR